MIGMILGNRYEIVEKIGSGGMALVYKARCRLLNRYVAVKILRQELIEDKEFISRFSIEAQAAASLSHPNVVSVYDVGQQDNIYYIVMEYVEGITLKEYIAENGPMKWREALNFSIQICSALEHAHKKHIVHRDIKPHNIIVTKDGMLKVTDFGIAHAVSTSTITMGGNTIGSVHYFSPEQARGGYTDEKSDIYSLGIVMYEMLTARVPFDGDRPVIVAMKHIQEQPVPPREINSSIPVAVESIILKAIAKEQRNRYASATAMLSDLYRAYDYPEEVLTESEDAIDSFPTQKIPAVAAGEEGKVLPENSKKKKKKMPKEDKVAVWAAIVTSLVIIGFITFGIIKAFYPGAVGFGEEEQVVPDLVGQDFKTAESLFANSKFKIVKEQEVYDSEVEKGRIISQEPAAKTKVKLPHEIKVTVSLGAKSIILEDLTNLEYRQAEIQLDRNELRYKVINESSDRIPEGIVIRHIPEAGVEVKAGDMVTLYVSSGREIKMVQVPSLIGKTEQEAIASIYQSGLVQGQITREQSDKPKNTVIRQSKSAGEEVEEKTAIDLVVSQGMPAEPEQNETPGNAEQLKERIISINLPDDKETVKLKVTANGKTIYEKTHNKAESPVEVKVKGIGKVEIQVFFDGVFQAKDEIDFGGDVQ